MLQTMTCIWWLLLIASIGAGGFFAWKTWKAGNRTEGYDAFGYLILTVGCVAIALLAASTICAIKLAGG